MHSGKFTKFHRPPTRPERKLSQTSGNPQDNKGLRFVLVSGSIKKGMELPLHNRPGLDAMEKRDSQDWTLVERCLRKEAGAWETVVNSHEKRIFNLCYRFTRHREDAEEFTQEVFLRVYQNLKAFRADSGCLQNWILRLGRNLLIDFYRQKLRFRGTLGTEGLQEIDIEDQNTPSPYRAAEQNENTRFLMSGLDELSSGTREAIILRELDGLSYDEIGKLMRAPVGTVKSRVSRGRLKLAETLCDVSFLRATAGPGTGTATTFRTSRRLSRTSTSHKRWLRYEPVFRSSRGNSELLQKTRRS
jgi:RNA polymerase sigma-70 factor (ECF subfamily)